MNYLPDAVNHGTEIYCSVLVESFDRNSDGTYTIFCRNLGTVGPSSFSVACDFLILGAGSLGSTEILLRTSQQNKSGMKFSSLLGANFGADGDFFGFSFNNPDPVNSVGFGNNDPVVMTKKYGPVGPCISGNEVHDNGLTCWIYRSVGFKR
jgi:cholesterol oxidase